MFLNKSTDTPSNLTDQAAKTAEQAIKVTQQATMDALDNLAGAVQDLRHKADPLLDRLHDTTHQLRLKAQHASDNTVSYIKHEPVKSMLIAAATGAAVMALVSLFSRNRH